MTSFWLTPGNRVMRWADYKRGTVKEFVHTSTGHARIKWDDGSTSVETPDALEPVYTEDRP